MTDARLREADEPGIQLLTQNYSVYDSLTPQRNNMHKRGTHIQPRTHVLTDARAYTDILTKDDV